MARRVVALLALVLAPLAAYGSEATAGVERFVSRLAAAHLTDVAVEQSFTLYQPDGRSPSSHGEQRIWIKTPRRQRMEQVIEGQHETRLMVEDRVWQRTADGRVAEVPRTDADRQGLYLIMPLGRTAAELLGEWRGLGIHDDVVSSARVGGRELTIIGARPGERDTPAIWLDPEYGVVRFISRQQLPTGEGVVDLALSEHRPVAGGLYFFPYRQEAFVNGKLLVLVIVRSVTVNGGLADALFDPDALRRER